MPVGLWAPHTLKWRQGESADRDGGWRQKGKKGNFPGAAVGVGRHAPRAPYRDVPPGPVRECSYVRKLTARYVVMPASTAVCFAGGVIITGNPDVWRHAVVTWRHSVATRRQWLTKWFKCYILMPQKHEREQLHGGTNTYAIQNKLQCNKRQNSARQRGIDVIKHELFWGTRVFLYLIAVGHVCLDLAPCLSDTLYLRCC